MFVCLYNCTYTLLHRINKGNEVNCELPYLTFLSQFHNFILKIYKCGNQILFYDGVVVKMLCSIFFLLKRDNDVMWHRQNSGAVVWIDILIDIRD